MKNALFLFVVKLAVLCIILFGIHYFILSEYYSNQTLYYPLQVIYFFLFSATLIVYGGLYTLSKFTKEYIGMGFLVGVLIKLLATVLFFIPFINNKEYSYLADILSFFIPYFLILILETVSVVQLLKNNKQL